MKIFWNNNSVILTVWQAFVEKAKLKKDQKVFIQAGYGGVGTIAIQLTKHLGATVATITSAVNTELVKGLGADIVIDYKTQDFETILKDYDLVLNSQDEKTLEKSLWILKPSGKVISISGPPDVAFAKEAGLNWLMKTVISFLSRKVRKQAKQLGLDYSFLFMKAIAKKLSAAGNKVIINERNEERLQNALKELDDAVAIQGDLSVEAYIITVATLP